PTSSSCAFTKNASVSRALFLVVDRARLGARRARRTDVRLRAAPAEPDPLNLEEKRSKRGPSMRERRFAAEGAEQRRGCQGRCHRYRGADRSVAGGEGPGAPCAERACTLRRAGLHDAPSGLARCAERACTMRRGGLHVAPRVLARRAEGACTLRRACLHVAHVAPSAPHPLHQSGTRALFL